MQAGALLGEAAEYDVLQRRLGLDRKRCCNDEAVAWIKKAPFGGGVVIELREIFEMADFGAALSAEMRTSEEQFRAKSGFAEK